MKGKEEQERKKHERRGKKSRENSLYSFQSSDISIYKEKLTPLGYRSTVIGRTPTFSLFRQLDPRNTKLGLSK